MSFKAKTIVVPVDFSGESKGALESASAFGGDVHCIHVLFPLGRITPTMEVDDLTEVDREDLVQKQLLELTASFSVAKTAVLHGTPGLEIADYAKRVSADLIVIPSHGYHGVKRMVLGSVAERVIRHAECSVMVLRRSDAE
ncbi:MAG: universal stress protein [Planctomycetaceae bacterium]